MLKESKLKRYKASAGSGKTFALTLEYFKIIFENPDAYKNILAVTFTNKATEEMKSRIIHELHRLAEGEESEYGKKLSEELGLNEEQLKNKASLLRTKLLHDYGRLSVTTIDRFFQRIVKSFTRELGIFAGYSVELDSEFVLLKAVDKIMQRVKENAELRNWISELMNNSVDEGKTWSIKSKIAELGEELFRENYMLLDKQVLHKFGDRQFMRDYRNFLMRIITSYEQRQVAIGKKAVEMIQEAGLELADFKSGKSGCASYFYKLLAENFDSPTATIRKGLNGSESWVTKTSVNKEKIEILCPPLIKLLQEAVELYDKEYKNYISAQHLYSNLYQLGIMNDLYQEVRNYCEEKGLMLLSDTTHILNMLIDNNDTSFLFEKCGNYYKHLMIDEFQDTSSMQWQNFRPLVMNSLGEGNYVMVVGDVKQSIYRWRNGDWKLLANELDKQFKHFGIQDVILKDNWRSAKEIVEFNNIFFENAASVLIQLYARDSSVEDPRIDTLRKAYCDVKQIARQSKEGYVDILFGPERKNEDCESEIMALVVADITGILERGGKQKDIVILVRSGREGAFVADYLMEYNKTADKNIHFISNDSLFIISSVYVQFIISILKYLIEPYDTVNKATILYFYDIFVLDKENTILHDIFKSIDEKDIFEILSTDFLGNSAQVLSYSLYETIETIIDKFSLKGKQAEIPYLIAFQDIIYEYESNHSNSITLFLEWWEKEKNKRVLSTSEEVDAVKILTIHKSKGLEFEYVILPFCDWELDSVRPARRIWCNVNEEGFNQLDSMPLNYSSKLANTIFREDYFDEHLNAYIDNLNLLYVAFTRTKAELYIRTYQPSFNKDGKLTDVGTFIYQVLQEVVAKGESEAIIEENGNFHSGCKKKAVLQISPGKNPLSLTTYPVYQPTGRICVKYRFRDYTESEDSGLSAIDEGKLLHEIFKGIQYKEDIQDAVQRAYLSGLIRYEEQEKYCAEIAAYLAQPAVCNWFTTAERIITEKDILFPNGDKIRPDRVILNGDRIQVIDYKFGRREESEYIRQVQFYCNILRKMGYSQVVGYIWYVKTGKIMTI